MALLEIDNLSVTFNGFKAVDDISIKLDAGDVLGVVGESGSGKSVTMLALMGLVGYPGVVESTRMVFDGKDLTTLTPRQRRAITGKDIAMIFQEPMSSLNPSFTVGFQIDEAIKLHQGGSKKERIERAVELLEQVGIPDPASRLKAYPHQMSGGMSQRIMIAMAIACNPKLLIADEPTTALDVTIQAQILDLLLDLQKKRDMALVLITHDMGVIAETARNVNVMYAGQVVEQRNVNDLFTTPRHPYTHALLQALPERSQGRKRLPTISGTVPGPYDRPQGCLFNPRCEFVQEKCHSEQPKLQVDASKLGSTRCFYPVAQQKESAT